MVRDNDQNVIRLNGKSILLLPIVDVQHQLSTTGFPGAHHMMTDHPNGTDFWRDSEVAGRFARWKHFKWADVACMIKANEGVLHSAGKCLTYMVLTDPLIVHSRVVAFTEL